MENSQYKNNILAFLYELLLLTYFGFLNSQITFPDSIQKVIFYIAILVSIVILLSMKNLGKDIYVYIAAIIFGGISYYFSGSNLFLWFALGLISLRNLDLSEITNLFFGYRSLIVGLIIALSLLGILSNTIITMYKNGILNAVSIYSFGYGHPNQAAQAVGILVLLYIGYIIKNKNVALLKFSILILFIGVFYYLTRSRTFIIFCSLAMLIGIAQFSKFLKKTLNLFLKKTYWIWVGLILFVGIGFPFLYSKTSNGVLEVINYLTSGRVAFSASVFKIYDLNLFGSIYQAGFSNLKHIYGINYFAVDNSYTFFLFNFGIIYTIGYFVLLLFSLKVLIKQQKNYFAYIILLINFWGLSENVVWIPSLNISFLVFCYAVNYYLKKKERNY